MLGRPRAPLVLALLPACLGSADHPEIGEAAFGDDELLQAVGVLTDDQGHSCPATLVSHELTVGATSSLLVATSKACFPDATADRLKFTAVASPSGLVGSWQYYVGSPRDGVLATDLQFVRLREYVQAPALPFGPASPQPARLHGTSGRYVSVPSGPAEQPAMTVSAPVVFGRTREGLLEASGSLQDLAGSSAAGCARAGSALVHDGVLVGVVAASRTVGARCEMRASPTFGNDWLVAPPVEAGLPEGTAEDAAICVMSSTTGWTAVPLQRDGRTAAGRVPGATVVGSFEYKYALCAGRGQDPWFGVEKSPSCDELPSNRFWYGQLRPAEGVLRDLVWKWRTWCPEQTAPAP